MPLLQRCRLHDGQLPQTSKTTKTWRNPDVAKCENCNTPWRGKLLLRSQHGKPTTEVESYRSSTKSYWSIQTSPKTNKTKNTTLTIILLEGFKLETPRLHIKSPQKSSSADDWQHQLSPKPIKTAALESDSTAQNLQHSTQETQSEDIYDLLYDAPTRQLLYKITNLFQKRLDPRNSTLTKKLCLNWNFLQRPKTTSPE